MSPTQPSSRLFALLRAALWGTQIEAPLFAEMTDEDWRKTYQLSANQGVLALAWDGLQLLPQPLQPARTIRIQWAYNVEQIELRYAKQKAAIGKLATFYASHNIPMMLLKGYGLSLSYPIPTHRPCGDIDIWLFGQQQEADRLLHAERGIEIDEDVHHHTVFVFDGVMVENHYDFFNIHAHQSNKIVESHLKQLAREASPQINVGEQKVALPTADFNALFLLRHASAHFAAVEIGLRHLVDWVMFIEHDGSKVNWATLYRIAKEMNIDHFLNCINAIAIDQLGLDPKMIPAFPRNKKLEIRVMNEILHPEFSEKQPSKGLLKIVWFKTRRWWANRWKHRIVYREGLLRSFIQSCYAHLLKPKTI